MGARTVLLYWGTRGGGSTFTLDLFDHLTSRLGRGDVILSLRADNAELQAFASRGAQVLTIPSPFGGGPLGPLRTVAALSGHWRALRALTPATVIVTMNSPVCAPFLPFLRMLGTRIVYVVHDPVPHRGDYQRVLQALVQVSFLHGAEEVVALSEFVASEIRRKVRRARLWQIPLEAIAPVPSPRRASRARGPVRLLFLGRLLAYKGIDLLYQALAPLRDDDRWQLTIAGDGPLSGTVKDVFKDLPQVRFELGWLPESRFDALIGSHDLLLCPYVEASQSGVLARALAAGLPAAVTPLGALPEQIGADPHQVPKAGLLAASATPDAFRDIILRVLQSPGLLQPLSDAALERVAEQRRQSRWFEVAAGAAGRA